MHLLMLRQLLTNRLNLKHWLENGELNNRYYFGYECFKLNDNHSTGNSTLIQFYTITCIFKNKLFMDEDYLLN